MTSLERLQSIAPTIAILLLGLGLLLFVASLRLFRKSRTDAYWRRRRSAGQRGWRFFIWSIFLTFFSGTICLATGLAGLASRTPTPAATAVAVQPDLTATEPPTAEVVAETATEETAITPPIATEAVPQASETPQATLTETPAPTLNLLMTVLTFTPSASRTASHTPSATHTASATFTPSDTPTPSRTPSPATVVISGPTLMNRTATRTPTATRRPSNTPAPQPSARPTSTATTIPSVTMTPTVAPTLTRTVTVTASIAPSGTNTPSATPSSTHTASPTASVTPTRTATATPTTTPTFTPTASPTPTPTESATPVPSDTPLPPPTTTATFVPLPFAGQATLVSSVTPDAAARLTIAALDNRISASSEPISPATTFQAGFSRIYCFVDYSAMRTGVVWRRELWYEGQVVQASSYLWGTSANATGGTGRIFFFFGLPGGFGPGKYEIRLYIGAGPTPAATVAFTVTGP